MAEITQMVFDVYTTVASNKKINLIKEIPSDIYVYVDKDILNTVLWSLINNSVKYTKENGRVVVPASIVKNELMISVVMSCMLIVKDYIVDLCSIVILNDWHLINKWL